MAGSVFSGMATAKPKGDYAYIGPGDYIVHINQFGTKKTRKGPEGIFFNVTIVAVLDTTAAAKANMQPHRPGEKATWMVTTASDTALPTMKRAIMNVTGVPEEMVDEQFCEALASAAQPLAGMYVLYQGNQITTKKGISITDRRFVRRFSKSELMANAQAMANIEHLKLSLENADDKAK